jgi:hypothetical protein
MTKLLHEELTNFKDVILKETFEKINSQDENKALSREIKILKCVVVSH